MYRRWQEAETENEILKKEIERLRAPVKEEHDVLTGLFEE